MVQGTVNQESLQRRRKRSDIQTFSDESWDSTKEVLGHCSLGTVLGQHSLGTVQPWGSLGPEQSWYETVLGHWSWDVSLGTLVLGH